MFLQPVQEQRWSDSTLTHRHPWSRVDRKKLTSPSQPNEPCFACHVHMYYTCPQYKYLQYFLSAFLFYFHNLNLENTMRCCHLVAILALVCSSSLVISTPLPTLSASPSSTPISTIKSTSSSLGIFAHSSPSTPHVEPLLSHRLLQKRSEAFSRLLTGLDPTPPAIVLNPELPIIPNVFIPMTIHSRKGPQPEPPDVTTVVIPPNSSRRPSATGHSGSTSYNHVGSPPGVIPVGFESIVQQCITDRSPTLPLTFVPEVGAVRLFALSSFRTEVEIVKGCGCVALERPTIVESFVGSRNHSFAFYTDGRCETEPFFRRFKQHFDLEPARLAASIRIIQGVMAPIPAASELPDMI